MATSLLGAFTSLISGRPWSDLPSTFCFSIGEKVPLRFGSVFELYDGHHTSDRSPVSIFIHDKKNPNVLPSLAASYLDYAKCSLKNVRTVRHPYILKTLGAVEVPSGIYIATEHVRPLICEETPPPDPLWGLYQIGSAIEFLNADVKVVHGLVCPYSIFTTVNEAHWRLGTFDIFRPLSNYTSPYDMINSIRNHPLREQGYLPPSDQLTLLGIDRWSFASFIAWSFAAAKQKSFEGLQLAPESNLFRLDAKIQQLCNQLLRDAKTAREPFNFQEITKSNPLFTHSSILRVMIFFEQINLKGNWEKELFFNELPKDLMSIPSEIQSRQVLPQLAKQLDFNGHPEILLNSIFIIGENLMTTQNEEYSSRIVPLLVKLFKCPDRAVRFCLLQNLSQYEKFLTSAEVESFFDSLSLGLTDSSKILREATLKSMCVFLPILKKPSAIDKAIRLMTRLIQSDSECSIRTNGIICLAKLGCCIPKEQHANILLGSLKDPFPPCRLATLHSLSFCIEQGNFSPTECITKLSPIVSQRCVDTDLEVRHLAFATLEEIVRHSRMHLDTFESKEDIPKIQSIQPTTKDVQDSTTSWASWVLNKAVDFYSVSSTEANESLVDITPSGNLKAAAPPPTIQQPPSSINQSKMAAKSEVENFFDAEEELEFGSDYAAEWNRLDPVEEKTDVISEERVNEVVSSLYPNSPVIPKCPMEVSPVIKTNVLLSSGDQLLPTAASLPRVLPKRKAATKKIVSKPSIDEEEFWKGFDQQQDQGVKSDRRPNQTRSLKDILADRKKQPQGSSTEDLLRTLF